MKKSPEKIISELDTIANLMDSHFSIGKFTFGIDGLIGLLPGIGDTLGGLISVYIVLRGYQAGVSKTKVSKMLLLVWLDALFGSVPVLGDIFDFLFKVNKRNLATIKKELRVS